MHPEGRSVLKALGRPWNLEAPEVLPDPSHLLVPLAPLGQWHPSHPLRLPALLAPSDQLHLLRRSPPSVQLAPLGQLPLLVLQVPAIQPVLQLPPVRLVRSLRQGQQLQLVQPVLLGLLLLPALPFQLALAGP